MCPYCHDCKRIAYGTKQTHCDWYCDRWKFCSIPGCRCNGWRYQHRCHHQRRRLLSDHCFWAGDNRILLRRLQGAENRSRQCYFPQRPDGDGRQPPRWNRGNRLRCGQKEGCHRIYRQCQRRPDRQGPELQCPREPPWQGLRCHYPQRCHTGLRCSARNHPRYG